ncbi:hypothetical protein A2U01_0062353, partial [Trifolium medium]|nr:hypothetical protein [Trifolium medium]
MKHTIAERALQRALASVCVLEMSLSEPQRLVARLLADSHQEDENFLPSFANPRQ